ncbi:AAA family ATPase [Aeromicrobium sp. S22]|uniref:ATP-binding protein n=1 Tax=Aeromicrobium sp. S22 TaxID=2662029 RepID=UPI00129DD514|nr:AAA family ATPase [Aeromicrobium sp. S22]
MKTVIYLTGPPGIGKTTLAGGLERLAGAEVISYGSLLTKTHKVIDQADLRRQSAQVITPSSVQDIDRAMAERVAQSVRSVVVIDSHALTRERYGFRAIPYDVATLRSLGLTTVVCLFADPATVGRRHDVDRAGRREGTPFHLSTHMDLQASLALTYSHTAGVPVHFIDATDTPEEVLRLTIGACGLRSS